MKYAVEAKIFSNGKIVAKMRAAEDGETDSYRETRACDIYIDIFDTETEARDFLRDYRYA